MSIICKAMVMVMVIVIVIADRLQFCAQGCIHTMQVQPVAT